MEELDLREEKDYIRVAVLAGHVCDTQWMRPGWKRWPQQDSNPIPIQCKVFAAAAWRRATDA